jgi:hypothetical protein
MATPWCRLWADMPNDPKWRTIARISKQSIGDVIAVYVHMMTCATNATERGRTQSFVCEDVAAALDLLESDIAAIQDAMQGRVLDGNYLAGWEKRQPMKEDGAAERAKAWRLAQKEAPERNRTQTNAQERPDTDTDTDSELKAIVSSDHAADSLPGHPAKPDCPHQDIIAIYHEVLPQCPQVRDWTPARATQLRARWNESPDRQHLAYWRRFFEYAGQSDFLMGRTGPKPFFADLEWMTKSGNFTKIREAKYENRSNA